MEDEIKNFFAVMQDVLGSDTAPDSSKLKRALSRKRSQGEFPCHYLYRAWALAQMCCAAPVWEQPELLGICWPSTENPLTIQVLQDLLAHLAQVEIPDIADNSLAPAADMRLTLLDILNRVELEQAYRLNVVLYSHRGNAFSPQQWRR